MDFNRRLIHPLPFYMTYSGYLSPAQESAALQDLEYLQRLADSMVQVLRQEETEDCEEDPERWSRTADMVQVLLCNEIYKRRHGGKRGGIFYL